MRYLAYIVDDVIISKKRTDLTDEQAISLDSFLRKCGLLKENEDIAIIEDA